MDIHLNDILLAMKALMEEDNQFVSEADFLFHFARKIKNPDMLYFDYRSDNNAKYGDYIDCVIEQNNTLTPVEFKYKPKKTILQNGYTLKNQSWISYHKYLLLKDLAKIENFKAHKSCKTAQTGFVIFLTNEESYWATGKQNEIQCHSDATLKSGSYKGKNITLEKKYRCNWKDFSGIKDEDGKDAGFKYLAIEAIIKS